MFVSKEDLFNGIQFSAIQSDKFKASVLVFSVTIPLTPENFAHNILISGLLRRGTKDLPSMAELNRRLDELYGSYVEIRGSILGNNLCLTVSSEVLDNRYIPDGTDTLGGVIDIISQILLTPHLCDEDFNTELFLQEKKIAVDNLLAEKNNTRSYSIKKCAELLGEGISLLPSTKRLLKLIEGTQLSEVVSYFKNSLMGAPLDIFYIGASDPASIRRKLELSLKDRVCTSKKAPIMPLPYKRDRFCEQVERLAVTQGKLAMGFSTGVNISLGDDRYYTALMLNEILGGSPSSKLFVNVREKMSLCYYCSSSYSIYTGVLMVSSGIENEKIEIVKSAILDQLVEIQKGCISDYEIKAAQSSISNSHRQLYDSPFDIQSFYSSRALFGIPDTIEDCCNKLMTVTREDISALAKEITLDAVFFVEGTLKGEDGEEELDNE